MPRGRRRLPPRCIELVRESQLVLHAGDLIEASFLAELEAIGPPVEAICGNVDGPALRRRLPERLELDLAGTRVGMIHDAGPSRGRVARLRRLFPDAAAVVFGHSHIPMHESVAGFQIFNPGSPTERRRSPSHSMGMLRIEQGRMRFELIEL